jgi:thiamine biosynthesis lipoprotein ApbE
VLVDRAAASVGADGRFDITSGALRRVWRFDGSGSLPDPERVAETLAVVGWYGVSCIIRNSLPATTPRRRYDSPHDSVS